MSRDDLHTREFRRILLIKPSSPGDIIHALPVLQGLRRRYPAAHIAWLVATPFANLIETHPALNEVIHFDRKRFGKIGRSAGVTLEFLGFVRALRHKEFDLVIDLQGLFRSGFLSKASGAPVRIGFASAREMAWMFYSHRLPERSPHAHAADRNYQVAPALGLPDGPLSFEIHVTPEDRAVAAALIGEARVDPGRGYVVLVPLTRWETKCWPTDRYGKLAGLIKDRHGLTSLLVGGASDVAAAGIAVQASDGAAINLCGRTTLRQLAALIEGASVVVTADSTPMHLAAVLGRPLVALFGPTDPRRTGPYGRLADVVSLPLECSPCLFRRLSQCPYDHACMRDLDVDQVAAAVDLRLSVPAAGPSR
jgi:lipopolysaccharide heptosyltransferase I